MIPNSKLCRSDYEQIDELAESENRATPRISKARIAEMIEEAIVDAYGKSELTTGWFTMIDEHLAVPATGTAMVYDHDMKR